MQRKFATFFPSDFTLQGKSGGGNIHSKIENTIANLENGQDASAGKMFFQIPLILKVTLCN